MATRINTPYRNALADAAAYHLQGGSAVLRIYTGPQPASANDNPGGSLLAQIDLPDTPFGAASEGVSSKEGTWEGTVTISGDAGWFRFTSGDGNFRIDGSCGEGSGDLSFDNASFIEGGTVTISAFTITQPAS